LATAGKKIHGISAVPGGIHKNLSLEQRDKFIKGADPQNIDKMIEWSEGAIDFFLGYHKKNAAMLDTMAAFPSNHLSLVRHDGALDLYHGNLRAVDANGKRILNDIAYEEYNDHILEEVRDYSYCKFPFLKKYGEKEGWYRVGPLARLNTIDFIPSPRAQKRFEEFKAYTHGKPNNMSMHMHWARLIETLHAAEVMKELLYDPDLQGTDLVTVGKRRNEGIGLIEAPRGTLFHHYRVNDDGAITKANLIVSTTNNNQAMNTAVSFVAKDMISGKKEIPEYLLNYIEVAIRAYDPCLSCSTHAMGQMPLHVTLLDSAGNILDEVIKN
jgi:NAD-reducing hydrogenase large subunit